MRKEVVIFLFILLLPICFARNVPIGEVGGSDYSIDTEGSTYYALLNDKGVANIEGGVVTYYHEDRLGSNILTSNGEVKESKTLPFGKGLENDGLRFTFTGKELDSSQLYYYGARYYDYNLGRFISADPVMDEKPYSYVDNNPLKYIDPTGEIKVAHLALDNIDSQIAMEKAIKDAGGEFYYLRNKGDKIPRGTEVFVGSGHHGDGSFEIYGEYASMYYSESPESNDVCVLMFGACRTTVSPFAEYNHGNTAEAISILQERYPNLKLVFGYETGSPLYDDDVQAELALVLSKYESLDGADLKALGKELMDVGHKKLKERGYYSRFSFILIGGEEHMFFSKKYPEGESFEPFKETIDKERYPPARTVFEEILEGGGP